MSDLADVVDYPIIDNSPRVNLAVTLSISSMQFAAAVRVLIESGLLLGASASLRSQYEALVRSVWVLHRATEAQVGKLSSELNEQTQQASKNIPLVNEMITELARVPQLENLMVPLMEFKQSSWLPLNSFVHSGIHAVHWTNNEPPPQLLDQIFRISNGLSVLAFMNIGLLTGRPRIQTEIIAATACYSSSLPKHRNGI